MKTNFFKNIFSGAKDRVIKFSNSNIFVKFFISIMIWVVCLVPTWIVSGIWWLVNPQSDVAKAIILVPSIMVLGIPQVVLAVAGLFLTCAVILEDF